MHNRMFYHQVYHGRSQRKRAVQRVRAKEILEAVSAETATRTGNDFLRALLSHLANAFQVQRAFITECTDRTLTRVRTIALYVEKTFQENIECDLSATP